MRIWLKYLIGIAIGLISALVFSPSTAQGQAVLDFIVEIAVRFGRYALLPVLFFSVSISFFKLRDEKLLTKASLWTFSVIFSSSFALMLLGLVSALAIKLPRIPITTEKASEVSSFAWQTLITKLFPFSGTDGAYLFHYFTKDEFKTLTIYVSEYQSGTLISKSKVADLDHDGIDSPSRGVIAVVPDFESFKVNPHQQFLP